MNIDTSQEFVIDAAEPRVVIRKIRQALGLSQEALAKAAGLARVEVVHLEGGKNQGTSARMRSAIAKGLGLDRADVDEIFAGAFGVGAALRKIEKNRKAAVRKARRAARASSEVVS